MLRVSVCNRGASAAFHLYDYYAPFRLARMLQPGERTRRRFGVLRAKQTSGARGLRSAGLVGTRPRPEGAAMPEDPTREPALRDPRPVYLSALRGPCVYGRRCSRTGLGWGGTHVGPELRGRDGGAVPGLRLALRGLCDQQRGRLRGHPQGAPGDPRLGGHRLLLARGRRLDGLCPSR